MSNKPRAHAELIKAWADGAEIQYRKDAGMMWTDSADPAFVADYEYRVKPAHEYPKLDVDEINRLASHFCLQPGTIDLVSRRALQYMVDAGQVVTREDFAILSAAHERAVKSLYAAGFTDEGGQLWKPPLGNAYAERQKRDMAVAKAVYAAVWRSKRDGQELYPDLQLMIKDVK